MTTNEILNPLPPPLLPPPPEPPPLGPFAPPPPVDPPAPTCRAANGQFTVGNSGRPRGARNRVNAEIDRLLEEAAPDAVRTILGAAQCANVAAAQWILNRVAPARKGRTVILDEFPTINGPDDIAPALSAIAAAVADGEITVEEAALAADILQKFLDVLERTHRLRSGLLPPK
jgi:hypothetical protein